MTALPRLKLGTGALIGQGAGRVARATAARHPQELNAGAEVWVYFRRWQAGVIQRVITRDPAKAHHGQARGNDLDAIATDIAELMPEDARVRVRYDGARSRIDVILQNPHHFPDSTGTGSVGEAHRMMLRITTADNGEGGFRLRWSAERIRCINCTLRKGDNVVFLARHTRDDLVDTARSALRAQGLAAEGFASAWRAAWHRYYLDGTRKGDPIGAEEALRRMVFHGLIRIPGLKKADVWGAVKAAYDAEPGGGDSVAAIHNAITRAAHTAETARSWADDEVEEQAAELLYQKVHVLAEIPDEERAELEW